MSAEHGSYQQQGERPLFLDVKPGMTVCVQCDYLAGETPTQDWYMGQVLHCGGAARDPAVHNLFQIVDVDTGVIKWVNADLVTHIVPEC